MHNLQSSVLSSSCSVKRLRFNLAHWRRPWDVYSLIDRLMPIKRHLISCNGGKIHSAPLTLRPFLHPSILNPISQQPITLLSGGFASNLLLSGFPARTLFFSCYFLLFFFLLCSQSRSRSMERKDSKFSISSKQCSLQSCRGKSSLTNLLTLP